MDRRQLISGAVASTLFSPAIGNATIKDRDRRALTSHIEFRFSGRTVRPTVLLSLIEGRPIGWQLNREMHHYPVRGSLLNSLGKGVLRQPLETRIKTAKPAGDVYLYGSVLAIDSIAPSPLPNLCSVTHNDTEWQIKKRPTPLRLRNLPGVGRLFRTRVGRSFATRDELGVFLTPTLLTQPAN